MLTLGHSHFGEWASEKGTPKPTGQVSIIGPDLPPGIGTVALLAAANARGGAYAYSCNALTPISPSSRARIAKAAAWEAARVVK